ncbi:homoserine kinase [Pseudomonas oligotrophica]|uniref:homoserine kinase n=1 Tax=Pseudomonas oligotrophica TaxID=2912055 RepID=UPI001F025E47|nr:homoserine kinase [Pseudomonas oligotrophica]MCF7200831.1 homoserine kinase [Pseudomonas oligotrophica]
MSVFTPLRRDELEAFLAPYGLGRLQDFQGIASGTENSNFFVSLEGGEYVLTLVERGPVDDLPFFIELLDVLHRAGLPVPYALRTSDGQALRELAQKPALLQPRLPGRHVTLPNAHHCAEAGRFLARLHLSTAERVLERPSDRGLDWMQEQGPMLALGLPDEQLELLREALAEIAERRPKLLALPRANLHADLFRDNVLFEGNHLSGVIDFYNACSGPMLYDLAICVNDWCSHPNGEIDNERSEPLLAAYSALRRFTPAEAELWQPMLRVACVRFWLSRLIAAQRHDGKLEVQVKDPGEFYRLLAARQHPSSVLPFAF